MKIATTSICKNEKKYVMDFYNALKDEVDYITILDTGSTDGTYEMLQNLAIADSKVIVSQKTYNPWRFDTSRNDAMELLPKDADVFISIDLDERFEKGFADTIKANWKDNTIQGTYKYVWNHNEDGSPLHCFTYSKICKNDGNWIWKYPIHECLVRKEIDDLTKYEVVSFGEKIVLHHWQDTSVNRSNYLELLRMRAEEYGEDIDLLYYARENVFHNDYDKAIEVFTKVIDKGEEIKLDKPEKSYIHYMCGMCYLLKNDLAKGKELIRKSIEIDINYRDPYIELAKLALNEKDFAQSKWWIEGALKNTYRRFSWVEVGDVWNFVPYDILSVASFNSGDKVKALSASVIAMNLAPTNEGLKKNYNEILKSLTDKDFA